MKNALTLLFFLPLLAFGQNTESRKIINAALADKSGKQVVVKQVIPDSATAIAVAESILFRVYGRDQIISEKPYSATLVDGYWMITGSLPKSGATDTFSLGGTFFIILSAKDGKVIKLIHYK